MLDVLRSGMVAMGKQMREFDSVWADDCRVRHAVMMTNGTVALEAILRSLDIGPGNEVITTRVRCR